MYPFWECNSAPPLSMVKALHSGFSDSQKIRRLPDPVPVTLDFLNPELLGCNIVSRTNTVPSFKSFRSGVFVVHNHTPRHPATYPHAHTRIHHEKVITISAPTYYVVEHRWLCIAERNVCIIQTHCELSRDIVHRYGYSVRSAYDVVLLSNDDVMYTVGSVVVIYSSAQHNQRHYLRHTAAVTWYSLHSRICS